MLAILWFGFVWLSNISILSVPDEGFTRNQSVMRTKFDIYIFITLKDQNYFVLDQLDIGLMISYKEEERPCTEAY